MKIEFFAVFDAVAERYVDPFPAQNAGIALRGFEEACRTEGHAFAKHAEDYSLWLVGGFDPALGIMTGCTPVKIAMATSYVHREQNFALPEQLLDDENGQVRNIASPRDRGVFPPVDQVNLSEGVE